MRRRRPFTPTVADQLERREFLSGLPAFSRPVPFYREALIRRLGDTRAVPPTPTRLSLADRVERTFDSFIEDYRQARGIFLGSLNNQASNETNPTLSAFETYTVQRVDLLAEDLIGDLQPAALQSAGKKADAGLGARFFVTSKVNRLVPVTSNGVTPLTRVAPARGTLLRGLLDPLRIDPLSGSGGMNSSLAPIDPTGEAATLIILAQDSAIQASRSSILNGVQAYRRLFANS